ncbi:translocation and assembly module TamB [Edaphobacter aggregans]|uniref:Translocation and assembly module TamB n=1 Tax=Edaphobacter aggregans TaxID=570835 RepID=A0A428MFX4_9BACT|nr:translocation/assembly module TamB domain-containing protein [Edaphobacter aggregans]RSL15865.1 translocation and assembly module TamB [Edaphobacter aggregans]
MSDLEKKAHEVGHEAKEHAKRAVAKVKRSLSGTVGMVLAWLLGSLTVLGLVLFGAFAWYSTTPDFERRVGKEVVTVLENATGGRVELGRIRFDIWHLEVEANNLVIHGLEAPGEAPYLAVDKILLRVRLFDFFSRATGTGGPARVSLNYLRVEHPRVHLIIDKDGKTNQPVPKHPRTSEKPVIDTLLDLKARQVELANGVALLNNRAIPFDLAARDLNAEVHYIFLSDHYGATMDLKDLRTRLGKEAEAESSLHVEAELGRDLALLTRLDLHTGQASHLTATGSLRHFGKPEWEATASGSLELKQIASLTGVDTLKGGSVDLNLNGHNCVVTPVEAQRKPRLWEKLHPEQHAKPGSKVLPPDPNCIAGYLLVGSAKIHKATYRDEYVRLHDVDGSAQIHITPKELLLTAMTGYLPGGGKAEGDLRISNWLGEVPAEAAVSPTAKAAVTTANKTATTIGAKPPVTGALKVPAVLPAHAYLTATVTAIPLRTIMDVTAPEDYGDLGFDTAVTGPVKVEWGGSTRDVSETVEVDGDLAMRPTGVRRMGALSDVPVTGHVKAHYTGSNETVRIEQITLQTPESNLVASGVLGVNLGDPLTALHVNLTVRDLGEYNQLLTTLGLEGNGNKGSAAIPVVLHGALEFNGTARGEVRDLNVKGHVQATDVEFALGSTDVQIDSLVADAEYSPNAGVVVASSTIHRGTAVLNASGEVRPRKEVSRRGVVTYEWDEGMAVDAMLQLANAQVVDVLQIVGQQKIPLTGSVVANAHAVGTIKNLSGSGHLALADGVVYGEPYESAVAELTVQGQDIEASKVVVKAHGMQLAGNGGYDLGSKRFHGHVEGHDLVLSKFETVKRAKVNADGVLTLVADANGTLADPGLKANLKLANVAYEGQAMGEAVAELHSQGKIAYLTANSTLVGAKVNLTGQAQLTDDYEAQARLTVAGLDIGKPLAMFGSGDVKAESLINGVATVNGPLKTPRLLSGTGEFNDVDVKLQGVELKAAEPLRLSLRNGIVTLEQVHITGQDTNIRVSGTAQLFGSTDPKGGRLDMKGVGTVSMAVLHTFDSDILSSGKVEFTVAVGGQMMNPTLSGKVQFDNVNIAIDGIPNGLSDMNGTLIFTEDRLQVQTLTAKTGGGDLKLGGSIRFRNGLFVDLTATGDAVRVRLYGLSATANANLRLQGTRQSSLLSGSILVTRFGIGQNVDLAAFSGIGGVSAPPDPSAPSNRIRLDVRVTSAPQLDFQNAFAKLAGAVDLTIRGTVATPSILGRIQITDGSATFAGQKYQLQRGDIFFSNPVRIDPTIDIDATAQVENYEITVGLHGTATNLKPTFRSEPPLSQADVFALLALGRTQEEAQLYQEKQLQAGTDPTTSALLGGALNATVSNRVEKLFGVGSVKIDPAFVGTLGNSSARITVQEQISKQITLTFATNVNTSAQQLIQVQYDLNRNNSIVVTRDESGVFSIVYKLRRRYR